MKPLWIEINSAPENKDKTFWKDSEGVHIQIWILPMLIWLFMLVITLPFYLLGVLK
jgi:hypothetical protein